MTTYVGRQENFTNSVKELIELEYDALEAYKMAISKLKNEHCKTRLQEYQTDHVRHIKELTQQLSNHTKDVPKSPSIKQWLTKGKVILANLMGDKKIIDSMISNENDTNQAYQNMCERPDKWQEIIPVLKSAWADEKRHKVGMLDLSQFLENNNDGKRADDISPPSANPSDKSSHFSTENADLDAMNYYDNDLGKKDAKETKEYKEDEESKK